jgi:acylphosphatase
MRKTLKAFADQLELVGYVKNVNDGSVLVHVQGDTLPITQFLNFCKQGSELSQVETLEYDEVDLEKYTQFDITHT